MNETLGATPVEIDALGQPCPMPLLMLKRALKQTKAPFIFILKASDPNSEIDIVRYCQLHQIKCTLTQNRAQEYHYLIES